MLNKMLSFLREQNMVEPGDTVVCAVSGGADSVAMLFAFYLLKEKLNITLEAVHFNHHLRGEESDRDEAFVRTLCDRYDIPLYVGSAEVKAGKKGLEAAARDARYGYFQQIPGKIATAHTADDNAETVLMHMVRGTGLKGLGGITPIRGNLIRPMLTVTRQDVEVFLEEWCLQHIEDSSNAADLFLRNRLRRHVMPLLKEENPRVAESLSKLALRLRLDEEYLSAQAGTMPGVEEMKAMHPAIQSRVLEKFLKDSGVKEPEESHISQAAALLYSQKPSARAQFPGGVTIARNYDRLEVLRDTAPLEEVKLNCPGETELPGFTVICEWASELVQDPCTFTVAPQGEMEVRSRRAGDAIRLSGGSKSLKKLFIDRKIPAAQRDQIPVLCDERGILGVATIGPAQDRAAKKLPAVTVRFMKKQGT